MPRFAANLTMLWSELPLLERLDRAAAAGFDAVEILFPYDQDPAALRQALDRANLALILFNLPVGDFAAGDRGLANDPARIGEFRDGVARALDLAAALRCPRLNCLVGLALPDLPLDTQLATAAANLADAADQAQAAGVRLGVEPLNPIDAPGFLLPTPPPPSPSSTAPTTPTSTSNTTSTTPSAPKGTSSPPSNPTSTASATSRSPTAPTATNPAPARSPTPSSSTPSTAPATPAGSASNTSPAAAPTPPSPGSANGATGRRGASRLVHHVWARFIAALQAGP